MLQKESNVMPWIPQHPICYAINCLLKSAENPMTNEQRLKRWRIRYRMHTGLSPVVFYRVAFCSICNKPAWIINPQHAHLSTRCASHDFLPDELDNYLLNLEIDLPAFLKPQSGI